MKFIFFIYTLYSLEVIYTLFLEYLHFNCHIRSDVGIFTYRVMSATLRKFKIWGAFGFQIFRLGMFNLSWFTQNTLPTAAGKNRKLISLKLVLPP